MKVNQVSGLIWEYGEWGRSQLLNFSLSTSNRLFYLTKSSPRATDLLTAVIERASLRPIGEMGTSYITPVKKKMIKIKTY